MVQSESGTVIVNSEANTLVDSELGTMVINESEDEEDSTMKRKSDFMYRMFHYTNTTITQSTLSLSWYA